MVYHLSARLSDDNNCEDAIMWCVCFRLITKFLFYNCGYFENKLCEVMCAFGVQAQ